MADVPQGGLPLAERRRAIVAISFGTALVAVDNTIASVALPTIARELAVAQASAVGVVTIYQMVLLMTLLPFSALGDRIGHKRLYQGGQALFLTATLLCIFATSLPMLLAARACQAVGVAAALSVSSALIRRIYPANRLGRGIGLNAIIVASGAALAPTIGGFILAVGSWRWVFAAAAPFALASLLLGRGLPHAPPSRKSYDLAGAVLCALMFGAAIGGLEAQTHTASRVLPIVLLTVSLLIGVAFVRRERGRSDPILPVDLLARPRFAFATVAAMVAFAGSVTFTLSLPFRLQSVYGMSPVEVGSVMAAWPLTMLVMAPLAGFLSDRTPRGLLGAVGMALTALGLILAAFLPADPGYLRLTAPLMLGGGGFGLFMAPNSHLIMSAAPPGRVASAGGLISTTRLVGSALGATGLAALLAAHLGEGPAPALVAAACALTAASCCLANMIIGAREPLGGGASPEHGPARP